MQYATGEAVIESSLLVIGRSAIRLAVETRDQEPCLLLQKGEGGSVLFSPAFSSFGMFSGYADRGKSFQNEVLCLKNLK